MAKEHHADIRQRIDELQREIAERRRCLPRHSVRPHQVLEIERLEERLADLERQLATAGIGTPGV
ncbi:MAG: histidine kinase [Deltaproteobacteria bacterium]|nr:histidine kinase [Candidatus Anaeroferrophillacea bacterium]